MKRSVGFFLLLFSPVAFADFITYCQMEDPGVQKTIDVLKEKFQETDCKKLRTKFERANVIDLMNSEITDIRPLNFAYRATVFKLGYDENYNRDIKSAPKIANFSEFAPHYGSKSLDLRNQDLQDKDLKILTFPDSLNFVTSLDISGNNRLTSFKDYSLQNLSTLTFDCIDGYRDGQPVPCNSSSWDGDIGKLKKDAKTSFKFQKAKITSSEYPFVDKPYVRFDEACASSDTEAQKTFSVLMEKLKINGCEALKKELRATRSLDLMNTEITDLSPLKYFANINDLKLGYNGDYKGDVKSAPKIRFLQPMGSQLLSALELNHTDVSERELFEFFSSQPNISDLTIIDHRYRNFRIEYQLPNISKFKFHCVEGYSDGKPVFCEKSSFDGSLRFLRMARFMKEISLEHPGTEFRDCPAEVKALKGICKEDDRSPASQKKIKPKR